MDDVKAIRKIIADRDFWKGTADERQVQVTAAQESSANWHNLYLSEKDRADRVQGGRITENAAAVTDLQKANFELHNQHAADVRKIGELTAENISLRAGRKWYFTAGAVVGGAAGVYLGRKTASFNIPGFPRP